ncbi:MAG: extracellular solute-binding protein [Calditrichaeota bacterium]|nr:extracellular solute-binding protein [Calditrichota bacterium]RQW02846.1 MAG: extracellular solute-binding protein [Calditrichota bacterium]
MRNTHINFLYRFLRVFLLIAVLAGIQCDENNRSGRDALLYWSANNPDEIHFAREMVKNWNESDPKIQVVHQPVPEGRSSEEIILAAVVGKTTPDIYSNMWQGDVEAYAQANVLIPLDTITGFLNFMTARCDSETIAEVTSLDGHIYQVPWKINPIMLLYNENIFENIGFQDPPDTYSDFLEAAARIQKDSDGDGYIDRWIGYCEVLVVWYQRFFDFYPLYLAASGGGSLVKGSEVKFNNEYAVEVFRFLKTLYEKRYLPRERLSARSDAFLAGVIATRFAGPWEIAHAEKFKPEGFKYSFQSMPVPDEQEGPVYTYGDPKNIVIFNTCKDPARAWRFIRFMIEKENDLKFLEITSQIPRRRNLFHDEFFRNFFQQNPKMIPFALQAEHVKGTDQSPVLKEIFDIISQEYEACVIYGTKSPETAIADAARAVELILP